MSSYLIKLITLTALLTTQTITQEAEDQETVNIIPSKYISLKPPLTEECKIKSCKI